MGLLPILTVFLIAAVLFFLMGSRRFLRLGAAVLICAAALSIYMVSAPTSGELNESDRLGNAAARLIIVVLSAISAAAFFSGYIFSVWRRRKSQTGIGGI